MVYTLKINNRKDGYEALYMLDNLIFGVAEVSTLKPLENKSFLKIQRVGLDSYVLDLEFSNGNPCMLNITYSGDTTTFESKMLGSKKILDFFGKKFNSVFNDDKLLSSYVNTHFSSLIPYLK